MDNKIKILVTGGSGFIGKCLIGKLINKKNYQIFNLDKNLNSSSEFKFKNTNYLRFKFINCDLLKKRLVKKVLFEIKPNIIVHLAAETHVDRSIDNPKIFVDNNVSGTFNILEGARSLYNEMPSEWKNKFIFYHAGTDEVYGSASKNQFFNEDSRYNPRSPYSASKAASNFLVQSWFNTYNLPIVIGNCSNNFGPKQFPEKLIPLAIYKALNNKKIPLYGDGQAVRDWIFVEDHVNAILSIIKFGKIGSTYCIGANNLKTNNQIIKDICLMLDEKINPSDSFLNLISYVKDRPGHDKRYALCTKKIKQDLRWAPKYSYKSALSLTVDWYIKNKEWYNQKLIYANYNCERLGLNI